MTSTVHTAVVTGVASTALCPIQVCFVVDDVTTAVSECVSRFGWGPFYQFCASVEGAEYRGWRGAKRTDVALGMAGAVQVELIHVHEGRDTVEAFQTKYGSGFQHLGIRCQNREDALKALEAIGGVLDDQSEYEGVRIAFVDVPTGPGMFELLQLAETTAPSGAAEQKRSDDRGEQERIVLDRATIVTSDMDAALRFYTSAFGWSDTKPESCTLRYASSESRVRRARGRAGKLILELVEPEQGGDDPYARHLARGRHGLVHAAGIVCGGTLPPYATLECAWLEDDESFALYDWAGGARTLQLRDAER